MRYLVLVIAAASSPVPHNTIWENVGLVLLLTGAALIYLCYRFAFKIKAKCLVIGSTTNALCPLDGSVVLGCKRHHRWRKPVAWIRHLGGAKWLDATVRLSRAARA
jgi:hypothetical protein